MCKCSIPIHLISTKFASSFCSIILFSLLCAYSSYMGVPKIEEKDLPKEQWKWRKRRKRKRKNPPWPLAMHESFKDAYLTLPFPSRDSPCREREERRRRKNRNFRRISTMCQNGVSAGVIFIFFEKSPKMLWKKRNLRSNIWQTWLLLNFSPVGLYKNFRPLAVHSRVEETENIPPFFFFFFFQLSKDGTESFFWGRTAEGN